MDGPRNLTIPPNPALIELSRLEQSAQRYKNSISAILTEYGCKPDPGENELPYLMRIMNTADIKSKDTLEKALIVRMLENDYALMKDYIKRIQEAKDEETFYLEEKKKLMNSVRLTSSQMAYAPPKEKIDEFSDECSTQEDN